MQRLFGRPTLVYACVFVNWKIAYIGSGNWRRELATADGADCVGNRPTYRRPLFGGTGVESREDWSGHRLSTYIEILGRHRGRIISRWAWREEWTEKTDERFRSESDGVLRPNLVMVGVPYSTPVDINGDGVVDELDYDNLVAQFGGPPDAAESADFNGDGLVDLYDFAIMRAYFGYGVAAASNAELVATTPEPSSAVLLLLGLGAVVRHRKI